MRILHVCLRTKDGKEFQFLLHLIKEEIDRKADALARSYFVERQGALDIRFVFEGFWHVSMACSDIEQVAARSCGSSSWRIKSGHSSLDFWYVFASTCHVRYRDSTCCPGCAVNASHSSQAWG